MLQPYLIALLMSKGVPMLWQGEEFAENYFLPDVGAGRVALLRPLRWDYFYDDSGQPIVGLVRKLLRIRRARDHIRRGTFFFFNDWDRYQSRGVLMFARYDGARYTLVGDQHRRRRPDGAVLVPDRRQLRRGAPRRRPRPQATSPRCSRSR